MAQGRFTTAHNTRGCRTVAGPGALRPLGAISPSDTSGTNGSVPTSRHCYCSEPCQPPSEPANRAPARPIVQRARYSKSFASAAESVSIPSKHQACPVPPSDGLARFPNLRAFALRTGLSRGRVGPARQGYRVLRTVSHFIKAYRPPRSFRVAAAVNKLWCRRHRGHASSHPLTRADAGAASEDQCETLETSRTQSRRSWPSGSVAPRLLAGLRQHATCAAHFNNCQRRWCRAASGCLRMRIPLPLVNRNDVAPLVQRHGHG